MFAGDETLAAKFGAETMQSILAEVGDPVSVKDTGTCPEQRQGGSEGTRPENVEDVEDVVHAE